MGTLNVSCVGSMTVATTAVPLSFTVVEASKLLPDSVMVSPTAPDAGAKPVMTGAPGMVTTKSVGLAAVTPLTVTVMRPVVAPVGTVVLIDPASEALTTAATPLKATALLDGGKRPVQAVFSERG